jgi:hypothetical protein
MIASAVPAIEGKPTSNRNILHWSFIVDRGTDSSLFDQLPRWLSTRSTST